MQWSTLCSSMLMRLRIQYIDVKVIGLSIYFTRTDMKGQNRGHGLGITVNRIRRENSGKSNVVVDKMIL